MNWLGYMLVIYGPLWPFATAGNPIGDWCLPRAGAWAYRDHPQPPAHRGDAA